MSEADQAELDHKALAAFVINNTDLERLEDLLDRFNIFEAVGLVRQEIRHSAFLAFLLNPKESHGLGDAFAKRLLQGAIMSAPDVSAPVTPIELSLWDLGEMEVRREWQHIDIFLLDERNRLAVIIENKIDTTEHSDQLQRYYETVKQQYPGYRILGLYLTPAGDESSHENYLPLGYGLVCEVLDSLAQSRVSVANSDLLVLITHYTEMLRRHIVGDSEIAKLCSQIYRKHQQAVDLIYEHRFARQEAIRKLLRKLINVTPNLVHDSDESYYSNGVAYVGFFVWDWNVPTLKVAAKGFGKSGLVLLFWFGNMWDRLDLSLELGPGDEETRSKLFSMAQENRSIFKELLESWSEETELEGTTLFSYLLLTPEFYEQATYSECEREIRKRWTEFLENDLPRIDAVLRNERWIWESDEA